MRACFLTGLIFVFIFLEGNHCPVISREPERTIADFSLFGFGEEGRKAWEISAKSADIFSELIELDDFVGTLYGQEEIILSAQRADFNKLQNWVHLQDNVVVTTESGARLTTDYLDWDRDSSSVNTEAPVDIRKDNMFLCGTGIKGNTNLQNIDLKRDVKLEISNKKKTVITCTGPLTINYAKNIAVFNNQVCVDDGESQMYADLMEVFLEMPELDGSNGIFAGSMSRIRMIVARGNVRIVRQDNSSLSDKAVYNADDETLTLTGKPKLIIYSTEDIDAPLGGKESI